MWRVSTFLLKKQFANQRHWYAWHWTNHKRAQFTSTVDMFVRVSVQTAAETSSPHHSGNKAGRMYSHVSCVLQHQKPAGGMVPISVHWFTAHMAHFPAPPHSFHMPIMPTSSHKLLYVRKQHCSSGVSQNVWLVIFYIFRMFSWSHLRVRRPWSTVPIFLLLSSTSFQPCPILILLTIKTYLPLIQQWVHLSARQ